MLRGRIFRMSGIVLLLLWGTLWIGSHWLALNVTSAGINPWSLSVSNGAIALLRWSAENPSDWTLSGAPPDPTFVVRLNAQYANARYRCAGVGMDPMLDNGRWGIGPWFTIPLWIPTVASSLLVWITWRRKRTPPEVRKVTLRRCFVLAPFIMLLIANIAAWSESCRSSHLLLFTHSRGTESVAVVDGCIVVMRDPPSPFVSIARHWKFQDSPNTFTTVDFIGDQFALDYGSARFHALGFCFHSGPFTFASIPFWFTTSGCASILYFVWRRTKPRVPRRAFQVEPALEKEKAT